MARGKINIFLAPSTDILQRSLSPEVADLQVHEHNRETQRRNWKHYRDGRVGELTSSPPKRWAQGSPGTCSFSKINFLQKRNCCPRWPNEAKYKFCFELNAISRFQKSPLTIKEVGFSSFTAMGILISPAFQWTVNMYRKQMVGFSCPREWAAWPEAWVLQSLLWTQFFGY